MHNNMKIWILMRTFQFIPQLVINLFPLIGTGWVWSFEDVSCASEIGYNKWRYYDPQSNEFIDAENTFSFTCVSSDCCLECTDFPNDDPPYDGTVFAFDIITENGKKTIEILYKTFYVFFTIF